MPDEGTCPRTLPRDDPGFLNRGREITAVRDRVAAADGQALVCVTGPAGIGKTTFAVRVGHLLADDFPGGVLYYEMRATEVGDQVDVADVIRHFLRQFGRRPEDIPESLEDCVATWRNATAHRRMLIVLDDVYSAAQVRSLLPASDGSAVIVTCRKNMVLLTSSMRFQELALDAFTDEDAIQLIRQQADRTRLDAEPDAAAKLLTACAGLPLALRLIAARILRLGNRTLAALVDRVVTAPFAHLRVDELSVETVYDACFAELEADAKRAYCLLGWHPGPHITVPGAAAILDLPKDDTEDILDHLVDCSLLARQDNGRYRFHALFSAHARTRSQAMAGEYNVRSARVRAVGHYTRRAVALGRAYSGRSQVNRYAIDTAPAFEGAEARDRASADLAVDEPVLRAAAEAAEEIGADEECAAIGEALKPWLYDTDRSSDLIAILRVAAPAARRLDEPRLSMRLHHDLGSAYEKTGAFAAALAEFGHSELIADSISDKLNAASAIEWAGLVHRQQNRPDLALDCFGRARAILTTATDADELQRIRALFLLDLHEGATVAEPGSVDAEPLLRGALEYFEGRCEKVNIARALLALGMLGTDDAEAHLVRAAALFTEIGLTTKRIDAIRRLARLKRNHGDVEQATTLMDSALDLARSAGLWSVVKDIDAEQ